LKWLEKFKRALIEKEYEKMESLLDNIPEFESQKDQKEALHLINEAKKAVKIEKDNTLKQMQKIQKTKKFLTQKNGEYSFDMSF